MGQLSARPAIRLDALTSLRFFAALIVVLFHCGRDAFGFMPLPIRGLMKNGYEAVGFFFVLSGFVLAYNYYTPERVSVRGGVWGFWKHRLARIYPIYLVALLIALPRYLWGMKLGVVAPADAHIALVAVPLLLQAWFFPLAISGAINLPAWSLSVEAFFYALFPAILRMTIALGPASTMFLGYAGLICSEYFRPVVGDYFPPYHLFTFLIGAGCGVWFKRTSPRPMGALLYFAAAVLCGIFAFRDLIPAFFLSRAILVPLFGVLIVTAASCAGKLKLLEHRLLILLGEASYSLYILHLPLYALFVAVCQRMHHDVLKSPLLTLCYLIAMVTISVFSYKWIEIPARSRLLKFSAK